jgi:hypothetical protein
MNDKTFVSLFVALGTKLYGLQTGLAAMVILNTDSGVFAVDDFLKVKARQRLSQFNRPLIPFSKWPKSYDEQFSYRD